MADERFRGVQIFEEVLAGRTVLKVGDKGPAVRILQESLRDMGFPMLVLRGGMGESGVDGAFGACTCKFLSAVSDLSWASGKSSGEELHGTYDYATMGKDVSHGCVRHYNEHIVQIFDSLSVGDYVAIVDRVDDPNLG